ncbi:MAG: hypothetical protein K5675_08610 [Lachnospiraceae bacterium]|nr:hypothetical protein [Lachnospiraceae bacterium]
MSKVITELQIPVISAADLYSIEKVTTELDDKGKRIDKPIVKMSDAISFKSKEKPDKWNLFRFKMKLEKSMVQEELVKQLRNENKTDDETLVNYRNQWYSNRIVYVKFNVGVRYIQKKTYVDEDGKEMFCNNGNPKSEWIYYSTDVRHTEMTDELRYKSVKSIKEIQEELYSNGFYIDGIHYVRWIRSAGMVKNGKCYFIDERFLKQMNEFTDCGINPYEHELQITPFEAYRALPLSGCIGKVRILPNNILLIPDQESKFSASVAITKMNPENKDHMLYTEDENAEIKNCIWDGEALADISLFQSAQLDDDKDISDKGMMLLRNKMFKSCAFNTNLQMWFKDNGIDSVEKLKERNPLAQTSAKKIEDIKIVITPTSVKYCKFGNNDTWFEDWKKEICNDFGIVKYDKAPKHNRGKWVLTNYQLLNTINLDVNEVEAVSKDTLDLVEEMCVNPAKVKEFCQWYVKAHDINEEDVYDTAFNTNVQALLSLMHLIPNFEITEAYMRIAKIVVEEIRKNIKCGRLYVNGTYATLLGNPLEYLKACIGDFNANTDSAIVGVEKIISSKFDEGERVVMARNPHITMGSVYLPEVVVNNEISKYFNLTNEIVVINSIGENTLQRLGGADFDSDSALLTNNATLVNAALKDYGKYRIPTSDINSITMKSKYSETELANADYKTAKNLIGEVVNLSQILNSLLWSDKYKDNEQLYKDICTLSALSGEEIDKAKKDFGKLDPEKEISVIRKRYENEIKRPYFFKNLDKRDNRNKRDEDDYENSDEMLCTMDKVSKIIEHKSLTIKNTDTTIRRVMKRKGESNKPIYKSITDKKVVDFGKKRKLDEKQMAQVNEYIRKVKEYIGRCYDFSEATNKEETKNKVKINNARFFREVSEIEGIQRIGVDATRSIITRLEKDYMESKVFPLALYGLMRIPKVQRIISKQV